MKVESLKDFVAKKSEIIVEARNRLNILGITKFENNYIVSWYNKIGKKDKHYIFKDLERAQKIFNLIMELQF